jgi:hypothetical protein
MPMRMNQAAVQEYRDTVWAIAASQWVKQFVIGYTSKTSRERFGAYKRRGFHHIATIANNLTLAEAKWLERELQDAIKKTGSRREVPYRKYHVEHRHLPHSPNFGRASAMELGPVHSVYMAWVAGASTALARVVPTTHPDQQSQCRRARHRPG